MRMKRFIFVFANFCEMFSKRKWHYSSYWFFIFHLFSYWSESALGKHHRFESINKIFLHTDTPAIYIMVHKCIASSVSPCVYRYIYIYWNGIYANLIEFWWYRFDFIFVRGIWKRMYWTNTTEYATYLSARSRVWKENVNKQDGGIKGTTRTTSFHEIACWIYKKLYRCKYHYKPHQ